MSNYWTDCLGNGNTIKNVNYFLFHKLKINISLTIMACSKQVRSQEIGVEGA